MITTTATIKKQRNNVNKRQKTHAKRIIRGHTNVIREDIGFIPALI